MTRYVCIHAHFYQPPRESPWSGEIEPEPSAAPFENWNQRITAECYAPNAAARILDGAGQAIRVLNNYSAISFNFGPTLLRWLERKAPETYAAIVAADRESAARFGGHGSALAQAYNHMVLPLANERDRRTQIIWGISDFTHRFGRQPEGMWLPETAVDLATLEALVEQGIRFSILAPSQALRVRELGAAAWVDLSAGNVDTSVPYLVKLPSGRSIVVFFYNGPLARAVAYEGLLSSGERLAERLVESLPDGDLAPRLAHIATDGESYGHHHRLGEMALAYAIHSIEHKRIASLTNYGQFLALRPPLKEAQIAEATSWSCVHGLERWRSGCSCRVGSEASDTSWRGPLRRALDWLRDSSAAMFEAAASELVSDPWGARDRYIEVVLDPRAVAVERFLAREATRRLSLAETDQVQGLMELQRNLMLMYTSCGWFFDDISGLESVQVLRYAARASELARHHLGIDFEPGLLSRLSQAKSNLAEYQDGAEVYRRRARRPAEPSAIVGAT